MNKWTFFAILHRVTETIWHLILMLFLGTKKNRIPPIRNEILLESATSLALKIRTKKVKSVDVLKAYIARIKEVNPLLNAVVDERYTDAIEEAIEADVYVERSGKTVEELAREKPLLGVPFTSKNAIGVQGLIMDSGVRIRQGDRAKVDSAVTANLRQAGAIPVCITNVPEYCMWMDASNTLYGVTKNPYDLTKSAGGSSGGESSLIGAGASVFGLGNDIFGSVRSPAYNCCIFAHKPTRLVVSNEGCYPSSFQTELDNFNVTGPMCRYATDLLPTYKIMCGANTKKLQLDTKVDVSKIKVYYTDDYPSGNYVSGIQSVMTEPIERVVSYLDKAHGIKAQKVKLPVPLARYMNIWMSKYGAAIPKMVSKMSEDPNFSVPKEILKWCLRMSSHSLHVLTFLGVHLHSTALDPEVSEENFRLFGKMDQMLKNLLGQDGVFLFPPQPTLPYYQAEQIFKFYNNGYTSIFSILGFPVTQCAMGLTEKGNMPLGVQVVATHHNDHLTLAMAEEIERAFGGWKTP